VSRTHIPARVVRVAADGRSLYGQRRSMQAVRCLLNHRATPSVPQVARHLRPSTTSSTFSSTSSSLRRRDYHFTGTSPAAMAEEPPTTATRAPAPTTTAAAASTAPATTAAAAAADDDALHLPVAPSPATAANKLKGWEFWHSMGDPKYHVAPMVVGLGSHPPPRHPAHSQPSLRCLNWQPKTCRALSAVPTKVEAC